MKKYAFVVAAIALIGLAVVLGAMSSVQAAVPDPLFAPTPVAGSVRNTAQSELVAFLPTMVYTADGNTTPLNIQEVDVVDLQWVVDQTVVAGAPNTTTLKMQFSNDGVNWVDGTTFLNANEADANDMQQYAVFGRFARINVNVTNANPITLTALAVAK